LVSSPMIFASDQGGFLGGEYGQTGDQTRSSQDGGTPGPSVKS
jgi:hypothetical protein